MAVHGSRALGLIKDTGISYLVQLALDKLFYCLQNSVGSLLGHGDELELEKIKSSLVTIQSVIESAEERPFKDRALVDWLEKLKDAAYDAEDVLDEYATEYLRQKVEAKNSNSVRDPVTNKVRRIDSSSLIDSVLNHEKVSEKLKEIRKRLESIEEQRHKFQLSEGKVQKWESKFKEQRQTHSFVPESEVYGRHEDKEKIVNLLLYEVAGHEDENVSVIPIVGIGGQGKTALAQLVFNDDRLQNHFQPKMWVCVSYDFNVNRLIGKIIDRATGIKISDLSDLEELQLRARQALNGRRFLLVLDDVWNEEYEEWDRLRVLLMCGGKGSRIIVTTRIQMIASIMSRIEPHHLEGLSEKDSWKLFASRAFRGCRENDHPNLVNIGKDIVRRCRGVPLAAITLGGLLSFKKEESQWAFVRDNELWSLAADEGVHGILPALRLSYYHLSPHLRLCFAFCAIFPKDSEMDKEFLIQLWMAHGCVPLRRGMELEDIGIEIMNELLIRSLFQEVKVDSVDVNEDYSLIIKVHDLLHDLAQSVMENDCFVTERGISINISKRVRHLSSHEIANDDGLTPPNNLNEAPHNLNEAQSLRTLVMLDSFEFVDPLDMAIFKSLRVLDLGIHCIPQSVLLPTSLGELIHLRYLRLANVKIESLPESISNLLNLQTLKLEFCESLRELPKGTRNLINLRCLDIEYCRKLSHMPAEIRKLSCLQKLSFFVVGDSASDCSGIEELQCLNDLRGKLRIERLERVAIPSNAQRANLIGKPNLDRLVLSWGDPSADAYDDTLRIEADEEVFKGLRPHENLKELFIYGYGGNHFPSWMMGSLLPSIVKIILESCTRCELPPLGQLPSLKFLHIGCTDSVENIGSEFYGNDMSERFPSLETLEICDLWSLKVWSGLHGDRVFPRLVTLQIEDCPMLTTIPCFTYLTALQKLTISGCSELANLPESMQELSTLRELHIMHCSQLPSLPEWVGNLTALQLLVIHNCPQMVSLPAGLQRLTGLQRLSITQCPELQRRCDETGQDFHKRQHIPEVELDDGAFMTVEWKMTYSHINF